MRVFLPRYRVGMLVAVLCLGPMANAQTTSSAPPPTGHVWFDVAGGVNARGFAVIPTEVSAATFVGVRYLPGSGPLSFRVSAMAKSSGSVNGQVAALTTTLVSLPSRRVGEAGFAPYAMLGAGWYGLSASGAGGGAHAGLGMQLGSQRHALLLEWSRHSRFDVSQVTLGLSGRFR